MSTSTLPETSTDVLNEPSSSVIDDTYHTSQTEAEDAGIEDEAWIKVRRTSNPVRSCIYAGRIPRVVQNCLADADELKQEGNEHFRAKRWEEALASYRAGLGRLPKRKAASSGGPPSQDKGKGRDEGPPDSDEDAEGASEGPAPAQGDVAPEAAAEQPPSELELECARARAVMNANIGACYVKLVSVRRVTPVFCSAEGVVQGEHKEVVAACTQGRRVHLAAHSLLTSCSSTCGRPDICESTTKTRCFQRAAEHMVLTQQCTRRFVPRLYVIGAYQD